ncbi:unnamed protein product [Calicophoron daubneyi]|uniref:PAP-associated domain-containing protein n=1 Tax=Calicophoron daubneyi TaxID=300641 RepID=A0AAV2T4L6_CALDB
MARYHPKLVNSPAWYLPAPVGNGPSPWNSGPHSAELSGQLNEMQTYQNQMLLPACLTSSYPPVPMANLQQNNAMPLLSYGRHCNGPFDGSKSFAYVHPLPQALLGPPMRHLQSQNYDFSPTYYTPHYPRSHPYSFIKRPSSSASSHQPSGFSSDEPPPPHINNHSSTEDGSRNAQPETPMSAEHRFSRSSSNCSNRHPSPDSSLNNTVTSDASLWRNDCSLNTSCTFTAVLDADGISSESREFCANSGQFLKPKAAREEEEDSGKTSPPTAKDDRPPRVELHLDPSNQMGDHPSHTVPLSPSQGQTRGLKSLPQPQPCACSPQSGVRNPGHSGTTPSNLNDIHVNSKEDSVDTLQKHPVQPSSSIQQCAQSKPANQPVASASTNPSGSLIVTTGRSLQMMSGGPLVPPGAPLSFASAQPNGMQFAACPLSPSSCMISSSLYMEALSLTIWQFYTTYRQSRAKYTKKVHLRNALHMVASGVFENAGLFIVGSSMNGFGSEQSDMDMCLTVTSRDLQQKKEAFVVLSQLLPPLRKCKRSRIYSTSMQPSILTTDMHRGSVEVDLGYRRGFIRNLHLIRAKVPILKFHDTLADVDCDLNVNNVVCIYNTHLLAMYTRIDWRVRPLGVFIKHWAERMDIHDGSRGRLSTYPLLLMLIHYLQSSCSPPILPNLQAKFPKVFNYARPLSELDMRLELPWAELRSNNPASLSELFVGFIHYYANEFDFTRWAVSVRHGGPLPIDMAIRRLPPHEQAHTARSFKIFIEEPFCQSNAARSLYDDNVLQRIRQAFLKTHQTLRAQRSLESIWVNTSPDTSERL